jgi:hypothetical protein
MIGTIAKALGLNSLWIWLAALVLAASAILAAYTYVDHKGYQRAVIVYQARIDTIVADYATAKADEVERQAAANNAAKAREAVRIAEMQAANAALQSQIKELADEADKDPDAGKPAIGASSVQRINKIR